VRALPVTNLPPDPRLAFLRDPDLYDLVGRLALRMVRDEAFAEDIRQGAYVVAIQLVRRGRGPRPGMERGWMCRVTRNHTYAELRRRKMKDVPPVKGDEMPDLPVEDHQTLHEEQLRLEKLYDATEMVAANHPEQVALLLVDDGRTKEGAAAGPKDAASRQRKARARAALGAAIVATVAVVAALFLWIRGDGGFGGPNVAAGRPQPRLAVPAREIALKSCAAHAWIFCIDDLERARALDDAVITSADEQTLHNAIAALRQQTLADCATGDPITCLEELGTARRYDPAGDHDPSVTAARADAIQRLRGAGGPGPSGTPAPSPHP
jgi:Sigma-70 region 2